MPRNVLGCQAKFPLCSPCLPLPYFHIFPDIILPNKDVLGARAVSVHCPTQRSQHLAIKWPHTKGGRSSTVVNVREREKQLRNRLLSLYFRSAALFSLSLSLSLSISTSSPLCLRHRRHHLPPPPLFSLLWPLSL